MRIFESTVILLHDVKERMFGPMKREGETSAEAIADYVEWQKEQAEIGRCPRFAEHWKMDDCDECPYGK